MLEFKYRWNLRQDIRNGGLDPAVGGFYNQPVLVAIQVLGVKRSTRRCTAFAAAVSRNAFKAEESLAP